MRPGERAARAAAYERARPEIMAHVPATARRVLDLGCATGTTGAALKARQPVEVVGVEREADYAREAAQRLDRVVTADVEALDPADLGRFDCLLAADVLEHLVDPWGALRRYAQLLEPGGTAIVVAPERRPLEHVRDLLRGTWPRKPEGIFDATHLRWFTLQDAQALLPRPACSPGRSSGAAGSPGAARAPTSSPRRC